jgi:Fatty acid desaturase/Cytochrome b5-like Heme/Steroid binding domain
MDHMAEIVGCFFFRGAPHKEKDSKRMWIWNGLVKQLNRSWRDCRRSRVVVTYGTMDYDVTQWLDQHPGGRRLLESAHGHDITEVYQSYHVRPFHMAPGVIPICHRERSQPASAFSAEYQNMRNRLYRRTSVHASWDPYDLLLWCALAVYLADWSVLTNIMSLLLLGGYGHQYVHTSSLKATCLTLGGFVSNLWREEHVFSHHPYTNTVQDVDWVVFQALERLPGPAWLRFIWTSLGIPLRSWWVYVQPETWKSATVADLLVIGYNVWRSWHSTVYHWFIVSSWFLLIDYLNHYASAPHPQQVDWMMQQRAASQNVVIWRWLYRHLPWLHSLLTMGLDRQVEHHLFPRLHMDRLSEPDVVADVQHVFSKETYTLLSQHFPHGIP